MSITTEDLKLILDAAIKLSIGDDAKQGDGFKAVPGSAFDVTKFVCDVIESTKEARLETVIDKASVADKLVIDNAVMQCKVTTIDSNKKQSVDNVEKKI
jgi:hypothetical protein